MSDTHVILYSGPESHEMDGARRFLADRRVQFQEKNVVEHSGARGELLHHTGKAEYPAINVNGHLVVGFFPEKWDHLLGNPANVRKH